MVDVILSCIVSQTLGTPRNAVGRTSLIVLANVPSTYNLSVTVIRSVSKKKAIEKLLDPTRVENNASTRPPNLSSVSCDLEI